MSTTVHAKNRNTDAEIIYSSLSLMGLRRIAPRKKRCTKLDMMDV